MPTSILTLFIQYEWTIKALKAGKHVLLEKPATNTAAEARSIFALAKEKNLIVMEAFHYRYVSRPLCHHPFCIAKTDAG